MGYIGSDPRNKDSVTTSQLVDDAVTNAKLVDDVLFSSVTSSIVSASGNITADTFTGTFNGALSSSAQIATSISGSSTSLSSSLSTRATTLESASGSFASDLVTLKGSGTAQGVGTSDSPTFADATITGTLTAQEVHTEFESASILFTSGSTQFGNSLDDNHVFSGSLLVTGSLVQLRGDSTKLRFSNDAGAERAFLQLNGTGLNIDTDSFIDFKPNNTFAARFDSNGRLGIGINSPSFTDGNGIHLADDFRIGFGDGANSRPDFQIGTENGTYLGIRAGEGSDTDDLAISTSGRLGIGTTSPSSLLHVSESSGTVAHIYGGSSPTLLFEAGAGDTNFIFKQGGSNRFLLGYEDGDAGFRFYDYNSSTTMVFFKNGGNVGIGTTNPGVQLDIYNTDHAILRLLAGTNKSASMRLRNDAQDWDVNLQTNDNFAIYDQTGAANALTIAPSTYAATFSGDVTISKNDAKLTVFASNTGDKEAIVIDRNTASNGDSQEIRWKLQGDSYPGGYILHEYDDASNSSLAFGVRDNGTPGTALSIDSSKNATFTSMVKASFFRTDVTATSVANATWTNISGLTSLSAGLYIIHVYKDNYAANDWSARGIVEATGHSTIDGDFENQTGFQLRVNGSDVQLYHTLGSTFGITARWIKIG